jgi:hypothetical protein
MRAVVMLGLAAVLIVVRGSIGAHPQTRQSYRAAAPGPTPPRAVSIPPPSGPAVVGIALAGTHTAVPAPADAVAVVVSGVKAMTTQPVEPEQLELVAGNPDALTFLVDAGLPGRAPLLVTARQVGGRWSFVGSQ